MSEYRYQVTTQYSGSMRITAKVNVRPGGTGHGLSNGMNVSFRSHQLPPSFLGFQNIEVSFNTLVRTP